MIFACPSCAASHFKPDAEAKAGVNVTCRRCKTAFRVTAAGVEALPPEAAATPAASDASPSATDAAPAASVAPSASDAGLTSEPGLAIAAAALNPETAKTIVASPFTVSTDLMQVPAGLAAGGLADALEPEPTEANALEPADPADEALNALDTSASSSAFSAAPAPSTDHVGDTAGLSSESTKVLDGPSLSTIGATFGSGSGPLPPMEGVRRETNPEAMTVVTGERVLAPPSSSKDSVHQFRKTEVQGKPVSALMSAVSGRVRELSRRFAAEPPQRKAIILAVPIAVLLLVVVLVALSGGPAPLQKQWVTSPASIWSGPAAQRGYVQIDTLPRGEEVVFLHEVYGDYSLVRDIWGRVGYVNRESLSDSQPVVTPEGQFPGCRQAPIEADKEACEARARTTHDACGNACAADGRCLARCQDRFVECIDGCKSRLTVPAPPAAVAETTETAEPAEPDDDVGADEAVEATDTKVAEKPIKASKTTKTTRTKKTTTTKQKRTKH